MLIHFVTATNSSCKVFDMHVGRHSQVSLGSFGMAWKSHRKFEWPAYSANSNHGLVYKLAKISYT